MTLKIENFGCRLNALEGDVVAARANEAGLENATIINGCAVTAEAMRQTGQAARRAKRTNPDAKVIVTGCAAQIDAPRFAAMPEVDLVLGNEEKLTAAAYKKQNIAVGDIMQKTIATPHPPVPQNDRARAFVQVQTGCDHRCTFCVIPFGRGNSRSVPPTQVVARVRDLVADGHKEVVLTGVDVTSYSRLGALVRGVLDGVPHLERLRLSSLDAVEMDTTLLDLVIHEPRLMPHLHLSLQAGDDIVLKRMKRRHTRAEAIDFCARIKTQRPDMVFGADLIAGFPTETEAMFENSLQLIEACGLVWLHVFPYSPRPNTPAAKMPQVAGDVIRARAARLRTAADTQRKSWLDSQIGKVQNVLVEKPGEGCCENFARMRVPENLERGAIVAIAATGHDGRVLESAR